MTTVVIDEKTKIGKLIMNMIKETNCGKIINHKKDGNLDSLISRTESDIKAGNIKKIDTSNLWK